MARSLQSSFNTLQEKEWLSTSIAQLNGKMMGDKTIEKLASDVLNQLTESTESSVAAIYLQGEDNRLHLAGSYALADQHCKKQLQIGEGIAGEAFRSEKHILVQNIPDDDLTISFATGNTKPKNIVAVPITRYNLPLGVIELGAMHNYLPHQLEFLDAVAANIGLAFSVPKAELKCRNFSKKLKLNLKNCKHNILN
ncbi:GAF domain-containing protein [Kaistella anthropi]|nr:GAF domain-containing protein [Kaistella anthropi]